MFFYVPEWQGRQYTFFERAQTTQELYDLTSMFDNSNVLMFKCYFLRKAHCTEQTIFMSIFPSGNHLSAESTEAMWIKCLAQGHMLMQPRVETLIAVSRIQHLTLMTNIYMPIYII